MLENRRAWKIAHFLQNSLLGIGSGACDNRRRGKRSKAKAKAKVGWSQASKHRKPMPWTWAGPSIFDPCHRWQALFELFFSCFFSRIFHPQEV